MYADAFFEIDPQWSRRPGRRLALNFLPASLIIASVLMVLRLPVIEQPVPWSELIVTILANEPDEAVTAPAEEEIPLTPVPVTPDRDAAAPGEQAVNQSHPTTDWYALIPAAARTAAEQPQAYSINPGFDEKRRLAAAQFAPSEAPVQRPIWENVEKDTLGRTVLVSGDCYRVLNDPNVGSREAFLTFGQYITTCAIYKRAPQELGFVSEIRNRRAGQARYGRPAAE